MAVLSKLILHSEFSGIQNFQAFRILRPQEVYNNFFDLFLDYFKAIDGLNINCIYHMTSHLGVK